MINSSQLLLVLKGNGIDKNSSRESVVSVLNSLGYSELGKQEALVLLEQQGWFGGTPIASFTPTPVAAPVPTSEPRYPLTSSPSKIHFLSIGIGLGIMLLIGGGVTYAYLQHIGPFSVTSYTEENIFSEMLLKFNQIDTAKYAISGALDVVPRDEDAKPFVVDTSRSNELIKKYTNDSKRLENAGKIIQALNQSVGYYPYFQDDQPSAIKTSYPAVITASDLKSRNYNQSVSIVDPVTKVAYEYKRVENGNNFNLIVNFETEDAVAAIKRYNYKPEHTIISGKSVTFTQASSEYIYMPSEPPKPFLLEISDSLRNMPSDVSAKIGVTALSEIKPTGLADWLFNVNAEGDFGDLTYKVNVDATKKNSDYFVKVNNMPSLFLFGDLGMIKGKWIKISSNVATSSDSYSNLSWLKNGIPEVEESYKENREKFVAFLKKVVTIADEEKLIRFKEKPRNETVDGQKLVRYDLGLKKEAIVPFYQRIQKEIENNPEFSDYSDIVDKGLIEYLQSTEFKEIFDYFDKNNSFVVWTDVAGFPVIMQNSMRVVPPDTATQLADKQITLVFKVALSDINKTINIEVPNEFITIEKLIKDYEKNQPVSLQSSVVNIRSNLGNIRAFAEIAYDENNGYGTKAFPIGSCKSTSGTLFAEPRILESLKAATNEDISKATCASTMINGRVIHWAISVPYPDNPEFSWCADSQGNSTQIDGKITAERCN